MHWNVSIGPEKWPIFGRFLTLFQLKSPVRRQKNTSNMAATVRNVIDDVTCKSSIGIQRFKKEAGDHGNRKTINYNV
jgi:hypothetical protein